MVQFELWKVLPGVSLHFSVDAFGLLFAFVACLLWLPTSLYCIGYMRGSKEHAQTRFFACFALALSATAGVAFAGNLLTLYLFYEIIITVNFPLVAHHQDGEARTGGQEIPDVLACYFHWLSIAGNDNYLPNYWNS